MFYLYSGPGRTAGAISAAWVYARGEGRSLAPVPPSQWGSTDTLREQLFDAVPGVREQAYEALLEREGEAGGLPILLQALSDDSAEVRSGALAAALDVGVDVPASQLQTLVSVDPSPRVRSLALEAAATKPEAKDIARSALRDQSEEVRDQAASMLATPAADSANDEQLRTLQGTATQRKKKGGG